MLKFIKSLACATLLLASPLLMAESLDVNSATADQLAKQLSGIGPAKAKAIIEYRETQGPFKSVDDLARVKGIGKSTVEKNRDRITVGPTPAATEPTAAPPAAMPAPAAPQ